MFAIVMEERGEDKNREEERNRKHTHTRGHNKEATKQKGLN
jgi:hypothetical protein